MNFRDDMFDKSDYLDTEAQDLEFKIESAHENDKGAFEVMCVVASGPLHGKKVRTRFWPNKETGNWSSYLKFFLTRFAELYIEDATGYKTLRDDINYSSFLKGKHFYADAKLGAPYNGKQYIQLDNFRSFETDASTWIEKPQKPTDTAAIPFSHSVSF